MIMTLAGQKVAQSLEYADATLWGFSKCQTAKVSHIPPPARASISEILRTHNELRRKFSTCWLANMKLIRNSLCKT